MCIMQILFVDTKRYFCKGGAYCGYTRNTRRENNSFGQQDTFRQIEFVNKWILQGSEGLSEVFWHKDMSPLIEDSSCVACAGKVPTNAVTIHSVSQSARGCKKNLRDWAFSQLGQTHLTFMNTIMNVDILIRRISDHQRVAGLQDYEWQTSPLWFCWSSLSPLISSLPWAFCPTLSVSPFHTLSSLRAGAGLAPPFPWHPSNFHKVQKKCSSGGDDIDGLLWSSPLPRPFLGTLLTSIRWSFDWWRRWWWWWYIYYDAVSVCHEKWALPPGSLL